MAKQTAVSSDLLDDLGTIKVPKSGDVLANRLQQQILSGAYPPGAPLPTERELVENTNLSRGSVREALHILESQGLITRRAGRYGGSIVSRPSDELLAGHINLFARGLRVKLSALIEARQALDPTVAYLAARNRTEADLQSLRAISERLDAAAASDLPGFLDENAKWHLAIAVASHNDLLRAFTHSISEMMLQASKLENFAPQETRLVVTKTHRRILAAIEAQDADAAKRRSERDVQAYARHVEAALLATASRPG
ncbi:MAG: GntR family transcriptional regulator [Rhodoferax sp.]|nr:GntR family transcriptional regulator [Rhodoferax sp.]